VVSVHLLYEDFLRFLDALAAGEGDAWDLYERHYLELHRAVLTAWWDQCLGLPEATWRRRVRRLRPEEYELLRAVVSADDLPALASDARARCQRILSLDTTPDVYLLVGFFSPDGFAFQIKGEWAIGLGLERLTGSRLVPILVAHEYAHCARRRFTLPKTLGERLVEEGFAVALAARAFPARPEADHLLMRPGQVVALRQYSEELWHALEPHLDSEDEAVAARLLYGQAEKREWPSRAGVYLGWQLVRRYLERRPDDFLAPTDRVLTSSPVA
jgi:hypothetical protein